MASMFAVCSIGCVAVTVAVNECSINHSTQYSHSTCTRSAAGLHKTRAERIHYSRLIWVPTQHSACLGCRHSHRWTPFGDRPSYRPRLVRALGTCTPPARDWFPLRAHALLPPAIGSHS
eukprot:375185-Pyramimonas_sp.AAC.1